MTKIYLLTGGNQQNRRSYLNRAAQYIEQFIGLIQQKSSIYETQAWGTHTAQADFLNQVLEVDTQLPSWAVLEQIHHIEAQMGRQRTEKWEPRCIDIDLLFYGHDIIQTSNLTVPHPQLHLRRFTLLPLSEIAPNLVHPKLKKNVTQLLSACKDDLMVRIR